MSETLTAVRERPFIAKPHEARAMNEGRMTQFRRPMKPQPSDWGYPSEGPDWYWPGVIDRKGILRPADYEVYGVWSYDGEHAWHCPFGAPGDVLWVKETWLHERVTRRESIKLLHPSTLHREYCYYKATYPSTLKPVPHYWRSPATMPKWACRLTLEIVDVRAERVCEISAGDALACGISPDFDPYSAVLPLSEGDYYDAFRDLWESDFPNHPWESTWAWAVTFREVPA